MLSVDDDQLARLASSGMSMVLIPDFYGDRLVARAISQHGVGLLLLGRHDGEVVQTIQVYESRPDSGYRWLMGDPASVLEDFVRPQEGEAPSELGLEAIVEVGAGSIGYRSIRHPRGFDSEHGLDGFGLQVFCRDRVG